MIKLFGKVSTLWWLRLPWIHFLSLCEQAKTNVEDDDDNPFISNVGGSNEFKRKLGMHIIWFFSVLLLFVFIEYYIK